MTRRDALVCGTLQDFAALGSSGFETPWAARVFGVTLAAAEAGAFTLGEFQQALIERIAAHEQGGRCIDSDSSYYERWVEALVALLRGKALVSESALLAAEDAIRAALRAAVHDHDHDHHGEHGRPEPQPLYAEGGRC